MKTPIPFTILPQPDDFTCGPTCLHGVYRFYGEKIALADVIRETPRLADGGTLAVHLGNMALKRGYRARIYTYNLRIFDPTWFATPRTDLREKLEAQGRHKRGAKFQTATRAYIEFLSRGGEIRFRDMSAALIRDYLSRSVPILTGLSATYLYHCAREIDHEEGRIEYDDLRGMPQGHFVVLTGYDRKSRLATVADPLHPNPFAPSQFYSVRIERIIGAILLGVLTYDANLLIIEPKPGAEIATREEAGTR